MSRDDFQARLSRVEAGHGHGNKKKVSLLPPWYERLLYPFTFVAAFLLGYATVVAARIARGQFMNDHAVTDATQAMDAAFAIILGMTIRAAFSIRDPLYIPANTVGTLAGITTLHNLVWWWPEISETVAGKPLVDQILATTQPNSVIFRGLVFAAEQS